MSEYLVLPPQLPGELDNTETRLANLMQSATIQVDGHKLTDEQKNRVLIALRTSSQLSPQEIEKACESAIIGELRALLADFYTSEAFGLWLALPHSLLGGKSALRCIAEGRGELPLRLARQLADGVYI